jgi:hypothetical protein
MSTEILSTARPSALRLLGFLAVLVGALLAGVGALSDWVIIGFPSDVERELDVNVPGTDVWEGKVVLAVALVSLVALIAMRLASSAAVRSSIAAVIALGGLTVVAIAAVDLTRATERFGRSEGLDDVVRALARKLGQPVEPVRALVQQNFSGTLRVDVGAGMPLAVAGGIILIVAGGLSLAWARRRRDDAGVLPS